MELLLRQERPEDCRAVEELTRAAFWNRYVPGCTEHYFLRRMRSHPDFVPGLDYVALSEGTLVGSIVYCRSAIRRADDSTLPTLTFGPLSVLPDFQGQGVGSALVRKTLSLAAESGAGAVVITGDPRYYHRLGFRSAEKWDITDGDGFYSPALMALPLRPGALDHAAGRFAEPEVFSHFDQSEFDAYDAAFPSLERGQSETQRDFVFLSQLRY